MTLRTIAVVAAALAFMIAGIAVFQDRLLYYPAKGTVAEVVQEGLVAWPDEADFRGLAAEPAGAASAEARGTAVVFHGNAGHAGHRTFYAKALTGLGLRVILAEYPGYGPRGGELGERSLVADAERTIDLAHARHSRPLLLIGESLGAGVAAAAAARRKDKVAGLLLITPWDRLENIAAYHYPWLPVNWLLRDRYDSALNLQKIGRPIVIVVAEGDSIVPARFGAALYEGLPQPKRLVVLPAAEHNDWPGRVDTAWWRAAIDTLLPPGGSGPAR